MSKLKSKTLQEFEQSAGYALTPQGLGAVFTEVIGQFGFCHWAGVFNKHAKKREQERAADLTMQMSMQLSFI